MGIENSSSRLKALSSLSSYACVDSRESRSATVAWNSAMNGRVYTCDMRSSRAILAILLSFALFVQGVAASTMRSCHMRSAAVVQSNPHALHQHHASDAGAELTDMLIASHAREQDAASTHHHNDSDTSKSSKLTNCAWCAACCMSLALPVSGVTSPELFSGTRTVFPPLSIAPPSRLPGGWDRPPRA